MAGLQKNKLTLNDPNEDTDDKSCNYDKSDNTKGDEKADEAHGVDTCSEKEEHYVCTTQEEYLRIIYSNFLRLVHPIESGLMDDFRAVGAMSSEEEDEVKAEISRKGKARRLWYFLQKVPATSFVDKCLPIIQRHFPHMQEGTKYQITSQLDSTCIRHLIVAHTTVKKFCDIFPPTSCCSAYEYRQLLDNKDWGENQWLAVFDLLKRNSHNSDLRERTLKVLADQGINQPGDFDEQFRDGFPCKCYEFKKPFPPTKKRTRQPAVVVPATAGDNAASSNGYPDTVASSERQTAKSDLETVHSSEGLGKDTTGPLAQTVPLITGDEKDIYKATLLKVDSALVDVSNVRTEFRKLEAIEGQLNILLGGDTDEGTVQNHFLRDSIELTKLEGKTIKVKNKMIRLHVSARKILQDTQGPEMGLVFKMSSSHFTALLRRRCLLEKEINEAAHFFRMSQDLIHNLQERFSKAHLGYTLRRIL